MLCTMHFELDQLHLLRLAPLSGSLCDKSINTNTFEAMAHMRSTRFRYCNDFTGMTVYQNYGLSYRNQATCRRFEKHPLKMTHTCLK